MRRCFDAGGVITLLGSMAWAVAASGAEPGLMGHWRFEEAEGLRIEDASGNGRHGQILDESRGVRRVKGRRGRAVECTRGPQDARGQAGCIAIPGFDDVDWSKGLTVEVWVHFVKLSRPRTYEIVSNTLDDRGPGFRLMLSWSSLWLRSGEGGAGSTWGAQSDPTVTAIRTGEWYHLAGTYYGTVFRVYVDGELTGENTPKRPLTPGGTTIYVGAYRGGFAYGLDGIVDDLKLYNHPRTPEQIVMDAKLRN